MGYCQTSDLAYWILSNVVVVVVNDIAPMTNFRASLVGLSQAIPPCFAHTFPSLNYSEH
jgi:hypothetical protein